MRDYRIKVRPFEVIDILQCEGLLGLNRHGRFHIKGHIKSDKEQEYLQKLAQDTWVDIVAVDEKKAENILFTGIIYDGCIEVRNGVKILDLELRTGSFLMDLKEHIRTYQNAGLSFGTVLNSFIGNYENGSFIQASGQGKQIGQMFCQYQETDWEFAKRLAGNCKTVLVADCHGRGVKFYFGYPVKACREVIHENEYQVKKVQGKVRYVIKSREIYPIGTGFSFQGKKVYVIEVKTAMEGNELYHTYSLSELSDIYEEVTYNMQLTGASLDGTVLKVEKDCVQVKIQEDENSGGSGSRWFSYATVYSSPDGTGWYCMPEPGDCVRVYFPSSHEDSAYVISSAHLESSDKEERSNPDCKSIMNKQGKEILFTPNSLIMTNNAGMSVELSDEDGIKIISDKAVVIQSEEAIEMSSANSKVEILAPKSISLQQGDTKMVLSEKLVMQGAKVKLD